ncbi:MAG: 2'-5' RNA ligase family protein [Egibacteraceae bacterium]
MSATAIVVPVPEAEPVVQRWRQRCTDDGAEGMPAHITLLYPFADPGVVIPERVGAVLRRFGPVKLTLTSAARFAGTSTVLFLEPVPDAAFRAMTAALTGAFPQYQPYGGAFDDVVPHLTVAASADEDVLARIERDVTRALPIHARATQVWLMEHRDSRWRIHTRFPLGHRFAVPNSDFGVYAHKNRSSGS